MQKALLYAVKSPLVPILVGAFTVLSMYAANSYKVDFGDVFIPLAISTVLAVVVWGLLYIGKVTRRGASFGASIITFFFMTWMVYPYVVIPAIFVMLGVIGTARLKKDLLVQTVQAVGIIACISIVASLIYGAVNNQPAILAVDNDTYVMAETPDIYFIVPDRMPSPESMRETGIDPTSFVSELESMGFYIRDDAISADPLLPDMGTGYSTTRTLRFLASVLNMGYEVPFDISYNIASSKVKNSEVVSILKDNGYTYYHIGSWYPETALNMNADYNYIYEGKFIGNFFYSTMFSSAVVDRSIIRYMNILTGDRIQEEYNRALFQANVIKEIAQNNNSPKFVFAHILMPHPEYCFKADGSMQDKDYDVWEASIEQIEYAQSYLLDIVKAIPQSAVIIIQADEGMCYRDSKINKTLSLAQWNGILTTWYYPGHDLSGVGYTEILGYVINNE